MGSLPEASAVTDALYTHTSHIASRDHTSHAFFKYTLDTYLTCASNVPQMHFQIHPRCTHTDIPQMHRSDIPQMHCPDIPQMHCHDFSNNHDEANVMR